MLRFVVGPRWLALHAALVLVLVSFILLGRWQLGSYEHHARPAADRPVVALDTLMRPGGRVVDADVGRRVSVRGSYDGDRTVLVPGRRLDGRTGVWVVCPLRTQDGVVTVVRGWVARRASPGAQAPSGQVRLTGQVQRSEDQSASAVDPLEPLPRDELPYVDTVSLLDTWPYHADQLYDGYVVARTESTASGPVDPRPSRLEARTASGGVSRWRNLAYALQWWLFAGAAVFFWGAILRRGWRDRLLTAQTDRSPGR